MELSISLRVALQQVVIGLLCVSIPSKCCDNQKVFDDIIFIRRATFFGDYTDADACSVRAVNKNFYAAQALYQKGQEALFYNRYRKQEDDAFPLCLLLLGGEIDDRENPPSLFTISITHGPSGNYLYGFLDTCDRARCHLAADGQLDVGSHKILKSDATTNLFFSQATSTMHRLWGQPPLFQGLVAKQEENDQIKLVILNTPTQKAITFPVPCGEIYEPILEQVKPHRCLLYGHATLKKNSTIMSDLMAMPWRVAIEEGGKKKQLEFYKFKIGEMEIAPLFLNLFYKTYFTDENDTDRDLTQDQRYTEYAPFFDTIVESTKQHTPSKSCDATLFDMCGALSICPDVESLITEDTTVLLRYAVLLWQYAQQEYEETGFWHPTEIQAQLITLSEVLLFAGVSKIYVSGESTNGTMQINPEGNIVVPTTAEMSYSPELRALFGTNKRAFLRYDVAQFDDERDEVRIQKLFTIFKRCYQAYATFPLEDITEHVEAQFYELAHERASTMWDNGTIGATWEFDDVGMHVSLYDFNMQEDDPYIGTYVLKDISDGSSITNIIYVAEGELCFFVDDKPIPW